MTAWKNVERKIARLLNGRRIPVSGRAGEPDVFCTDLAIEVKHRRTFPRWLLEAVEQAERAKRPGQTAVVILHQHGQRYDQALVVMRLQEFLQLRGKLVESNNNDA